MIKFLLIVLMFFSGGDDLHRTSRVNRAKTAAEKAYKDGNYKEALRNYIILTDSLKAEEEEINLNKAHCYYQLKDFKAAKETYSRLTTAKSNSLRSIANQQLGNLTYQEKNLDMAKNYYKAALKALPENNEARYNYELISRLLKKEEEKKDNQNQNQQNKDEKPEEPSPFAKKLKEQAEALAGSYKYEQAYNLMINGAKKDKTVMHFKEFIDRLKVVADLSKI